MDYQVPSISLCGGPHDGTTLPNGQEEYPNALKLIHLPGPPHSELGGEVEVHYERCYYVHGGGEIYRLAEIEDQTMANGMHRAMKAALAHFRTVHTLVNDARLMSGASPSRLPAGALPISVAEMLQRTGIINFRRYKQKRDEPLDALSD
jgi:hypothetical protein